MQEAAVDLGLNPILVDRTLSQENREGKKTFYQTQNDNKG